MANDPELDALLGAYALDALEPSERARVEVYIAANPRARDEVDELRESAAALALAPVDDVAAPPDLWDRIASTLGPREAAPPEPVALDAERARRRGWSRPVVAVLAVAASIAIIVLGAAVVRLNNDLDQSNQTGDERVALAFSNAASAPGAKQAALAPAHGAEVARVVLLPDGNGVLRNDGMKQLPSGQTYQLWALTGDPAHPTPISAGVLGAAPKGAMFRVSPDTHGFAVTIEHAPGAVSPTNAPIATATIS